MKKCTKCNEIKEFHLFYKSSSTKDGLRSKCIICTKEYNNSDHIKSKQKERRKLKKEHIKKISSEYRKRDYVKEKNSKYCKIWNDKNKEYVKCANKQRYLENCEDRKQYRKDYENKNPEWKSKYNKEYREKNKEKLNEYHKKYVYNKKQTDPLFKLKHNIRSLIYMSMKSKGFSKKTKTFEILGCEYDFFKLYLQERFTDGMNWENFGLWHIDHIIPISSGQTEEEIIKLNFYTNLQPLWGIDNLKKGKKINYDNNT